MHAGSLLMLIAELMDYTKSPQAEKFNKLFVSMDFYYIFKMRLPNFISSDSPNKILAMKLLHLYIIGKQINSEAQISTFFSQSAVKNNVLPELQGAFY